MDQERVAQDVERLESVLDEEQALSLLPENPSAYDTLHDFVVRVRLDGLKG